MTNPKTCVSELLRQAAAIEKILAQRIFPRPISARYHCRARARGSISECRDRRFCVDCTRTFSRRRAGEKQRSNLSTWILCGIGALPFFSFVAAQHSRDRLSHTWLDCPGRLPCPLPGDLGLALVAFA